MPGQDTGYCRQAWSATIHWWDSNAHDLAWMALLVGGAVLVTLLMR